MWDSVRRSLVGRDPVFAVAAPLVGLLGGGMIRIAYPSVAASLALVPDEPAEWVLLAVLVGLPALLAAWNDGLVVCWLLDFGPLFGVYLVRVGTASPTDPNAALYTPLGLAGVAAVGLGTAGFLVGVGLRSLIGGVRTWWLGRAAR